jgi:hypothetical protein
MAWYVRVSLAVGSVVIVSALALGTYRLGQAMGALPGEMTREFASLARQADALQSENERLRAALSASEHHAQIEQTTHGSLQGQMKALADENAELKEELAFFHTLMNAGGGTGNHGVSVDRFRVKRDVLPGEYRFQLLVAQARTRSRPFSGRIELVVDLEQAGRSEVLVLRKGAQEQDGYDLRFKFYQRVDGVFRVPPDAKVNRVQVRVIEDGANAPVSSQTVSVS